MTSATYRQQSRHPRLDELRQTDPNNDLLAYFPTRRLTAEELRDTMLHVTGELNPSARRTARSCPRSTWRWRCSRG